MNTPEDARLKQDFASLRENDRRAAPDFVKTLSSGRMPAARRRRSRRRMILAAMLLLIAAAGVMMSTRSHPSNARVAREPGPLLSWSSPTSFLLETPGKQLWTEIPSLGQNEIYGLPAARKERK